MTDDTLTTALNAVGMLANKNFPMAMAMMISPGLAGIGIGLVGAKACEAIGRNPEAGPKIWPMMILMAALAEAIAIYSLVVALILKFT